MLRDLNAMVTVWHSQPAKGKQGFRETIMGKRREAPSAERPG